MLCLCLIKLQIDIEVSAHLFSVCVYLWFCVCVCNVVIMNVLQLDGAGSHAVHSCALKTLKHEFSV